MKQSRKKGLAGTLAVLLALLAGCQGKITEVQTPAPTQSHSPQVTAQPIESFAPPVETDEGDNAIHVQDVRALLEAIEPGADIVLEPGSYNMSGFLENLSEQEVAAWNGSHDYVELRDCFDGREVVVRDVVDLYIAGGSENATDIELLVDPRYATVLNFSNCDYLILANLTIGHTQLGTCEGDVLGFDESQFVELFNLDLFGCGVTGINAGAGSGDFYVHQCTIRDCEFGPFKIEDCQGEFTFQDCVLTGSGWGGYYLDTRDTQLSFYNCSFGQNESNAWYFRDDIYADQQCGWTEPTVYPELPDIDPDNWEMP